MTLVWSERTRTWIDSPRFNLLARPWRRISACAPSDHLECWDLGDGGAASLTGLHGTVMSADSGVIWSDAIHGLRCMYPAFAYAISTDLRQFGDVTYVLGIRLQHNTQTADTLIMGYPGTATQHENYNAAGVVSILTTGELQWKHEYATKTAATHSVPWVIPVGSPGVLTARRADGRVTFFWNDLQLGATSAQLPDPTGGTGTGTNVYNLIAEGQSTMLGSLFGTAVYSRALTDAEIQSMARGVMGL